MPRVADPPFVALRHRNFRLLWTGQMFSFAGSTMQTAAILWHVALLVEPEKKGLALGLVGLTRLLPIVAFGPLTFAQDVLVVGARGYGWLYAAPSCGALLASAAMVWWVNRIERRGRVLLWAVAVYGVATVGFGLSRAFWLTFLCLAATGAADTVSLVLRHIIRQVETPDHLRGRVIGVSMVFFTGAPQLGEVESGLVAYWLGAPLAVVTGGLGCLAATASIAARTPVLRRYRR